MTSSSCLLSRYPACRQTPTRLIVLVGVALVEEVGSSGKVSLSEKVVLVLLAVEVGAVKEGSWFLLLWRVPSYVISVLYQGVCHRGGCCQGGFGILPSRHVSRWILGHAVS